MTSTTSFLSLSGFSQFRRTYLWSLKKNIGMTALLAVLLFLANPLPLLISMPGWAASAQAQEKLSAADKLWYFSSQYTNFITRIAPVLAAPIALLFCIVLCVGLFGYMQKKRSVDLYHALPVGRVPMLTGRWCAGLTALLLPLVLDYAAMGAIGASYGVSATEGSFSPLAQMLWILLMSVSAFTFCMFMMICTGTTLDAVLSILGVNGGYPLLILCVFSIAGMLLPGYTVDIGGNMALLTAFAPFAAAFVAVLQNHGVWFLIWWIALTAALFAGSVLLYQRRRSEAAEDNFAFPIPKLVIRFILTAVGGLGLGLILNIANGPGFFIGVLAGSAATHIVVEAIYSRGFKQMKKSFAWYGVFLVAFAAFYGVLCTGMFGYDTRVPDASQVESVAIDPDTYWTGNGSQIVMDENYQTIAKLAPSVKEEQNIRTVIAAQQQIIEAYRADFPYRLKPNQSSGLTVSYRMKDGSVMKRTYQSCSSDMDLQKILSPVYEKIAGMKEYAESSDLIFYVEPEDLERIEVRADDMKGDRSYPLDAGTAKRLQQAMQQDFLDGRVNRRADTKVSVTSSPFGGESAVSVASQVSVLNFQLDFRQGITAKNDRMRALLGKYQGKININGGYYSFTDESAATWKLLKELNYV